MKELVRLLFIFQLVLALGCHKAEDKPPAENRIDKATLLMDRGEYDSAIELLEDTLLHHENNDRVRLVLASAYAGRAGVKVENYWDYLVGFDVFLKDRPPQVLKDLIPTQRLPETLDEANKTKIQMLNGYYQDLQRLEHKTNKIPVVESEQLSDLYQARKTISTSESTSLRLYRSMLTAVVVKSEISLGNKVSAAWLASEKPHCQVRITDLSEWLNHVMSLVNDGLNDLSIAYPDDKESYQKAITGIKSGLTIVAGLSEYQDDLDTLCQSQN